MGLFVIALMIQPEPGETSTDVPREKHDRFPDGHPISLKG